jgi:protein-tyrosine phosphatase
LSLPTILFVCLGNICRSPLAEAALLHEAGLAGIEATIDSAGTGGWHAGESPDRRAITEARRHGIDISAYRARQVTRDDFARFGSIYALDHQNLTDLRKLAPAGSRARLSLLMDVVPGSEGQAVDDPWYGEAEDFARCWIEVRAAARAIVARLKA